MPRIVERNRQAIRVEQVSFSPSVFGTTWYVSTTGNAANSGKDPRDAFAKIAAAITAGSAGDTIVLSPGTHTVDVSVAALLPKDNMRIVGAVPSNGGKPSSIITADADDGINTILIDVSGVSFEDIEFLSVAVGATHLNLIGVSQTSAVNGLAFKNCWFNLNGVDAAVKALAVNDATNATTGLSVQNCRFLGGSGTTAQVDYIQVGVGGSISSMIENNVFELKSADGDCYGIHFVDNLAATNKSYANVIRNNDFMGPLDGGEDGVGVFFAAALTEKEILSMVRGNFFAYCSATPVTIDRMNKGVVNNYVGDDATGGTLVDPGT